MKPYPNHSGKAGVRAYHSAFNYIDVEFADGSIYRYNYNVTGKSEVEGMKQLAEAGEGLTTFINQYVRDRYAMKLK